MHIVHALVSCLLYIVFKLQIVVRKGGNGHSFTFLSMSSIRIIIIIIINISKTKWIA